MKLKWIILTGILTITGYLDGFTEEVMEPAPPPGMRSTKINLPDISIVGDIAPEMVFKEDLTKLENMPLREVEIALQGYIYPKIRADVFFAMHSHEGKMEPELEEGYVSILNLPGGFEIKIGRYLTNFGKTNRIHPHHRAYVDTPYVLEEFLGEHGLSGEGISIGYLFPLPFFLEVEAAANRPVSPHIHEHEGEENQEEARFGIYKELYNGRLRASFSITDNSELEIGGSYIYGWGPHYKEHKDIVSLFGSDITFKRWLSSYSRLILQGEFLYMRRSIPEDLLNRFGFYLFSGYRFNKYWSCGLRYDWSHTPEETKNIRRGISAMLTYSFTETTYMRPQYSYNSSEGEHILYIQFVFGIGPHTHPLE